MSLKGSTAQLATRIDLLKRLRMFVSTAVIIRERRELRLVPRLSHFML